MIHYHDIEQIPPTDFDRYLQIPAWSHSALKQEVNGVVANVERTPVMEFGQLVDAFITEPDQVDLNSPMYEAARRCAVRLRKDFGKAIELTEKQASFTANATRRIFTLPVKGRLDMLLPGQMVIDLKWSNSAEREVESLINFMGYRNQLWHYCKMAGVNEAVLMFYLAKDDKTFLRSFSFDGVEDNDFFAEKIEKLGKVSKADGGQ